MSISARRLSRTVNHLTLVTLATDTFTRTISNGLGIADSGQIWTVHAGSWSTNGTQAVAPTANGDHIATLDAGQANTSISIDATGIGDGKWVGVIARFQNTSNFYGVETDINNNRLKIFKFVGGARSELGTATANGLSRLTLATIETSNGLSIRTYVNGILASESYDTATSRPSGTRVGLRIGTLMAGEVTYDNLTVTNVTSIPQTPGGGGSSTMPVGNLPGWTQIVAEDFNDNVPIGGFVANNQAELTSAGAAGYQYYRDKLTMYPYPWGDTFNYAINDPSRVASISNSIFDIYLHTANGTAWCGTMRPKLPGGGVEQMYGRYTYRMRADSSAASFGAVALLWPGTPELGEHDWPEGNVGGQVEGFYHYDNPGGGQDHVTPPAAAYWNDWHVYTIEWQPNSVRWYIDGVLCYSRTGQYVTDTQAFWILQSGGANGVPSSSAQGHLQVDWICIYRYEP